MTSVGLKEVEHEKPYKIKELALAYEDYFYEIKITGTGNAWFTRYTTHNMTQFILGEIGSSSGQVHDLILSFNNQEELSYEHVSEKENSLEY